jgi:hypothetical protein
MVAVVALASPEPEAEVVARVLVPRQTATRGRRQQVAELAGPEPMVVMAELANNHRKATEQVERNLLERVAVDIVRLPAHDPAETAGMDRHAISSLWTVKTSCSC